MATPSESYPWFTVVQGAELCQADILENAPVFAPPADLQPDTLDTVEFGWEARDLMVMSQMCDLVKGRDKVEEVLFCPVYLRSEFKQSAAKLDNIRKGPRPGYQLLADCTVPDFNRQLRVVEFRRVHTLPLAFVRAQIADTPRPRLMPPYREHLSQAFARSFMRVGLPVDIPSLRS